MNASKLIGRDLGQCSDDANLNLDLLIWDPIYKIRDDFSLQEFSNNTVWHVFFNS